MTAGMTAEVKCLRVKSMAQLFRTMLSYPGLLYLALLFCIPPYQSGGYALWEAGSVNGFILLHTIKGLAQPVYPVFKVIPVVLVLALLAFKNKAARPFSLYAALSYILFGLLQGISITTERGIGICVSHVLLSFTIAVCWIGEARAPQNDFSLHTPLFWKLGAILLALLAFWGPANAAGLPDFHPAYLLNSGSGLVFCMMTPVYLAVLVVCFPKVNRNLLAVTSLVGFAYGLGNLAMAFVLHLTTWWVGLLHLPLLGLSVLGLGLLATKITRNI